jgi:hypothetical protein
MYVIIGFCQVSEVPHSACSQKAGDSGLEKPQTRAVLSHASGAYDRTHVPSKPIAQYFGLHICSVMTFMFIGN